VPPRPSLDRAPGRPTQEDLDSINSPFAATMMESCSVTQVRGHPLGPRQARSWRSGLSGRGARGAPRRNVVRVLQSCPALAKHTQTPRPHASMEAVAAAGTHELCCLHTDGAPPTDSVTTLTCVAPAPSAAPTHHRRHHRRRRRPLISAPPGQEAERHVPQRLAGRTGPPVKATAGGPAKAQLSHVAGQS
jgi:hypothetical protein